jgi:hypothetical protein
MAGIVPKNVSTSEFRTWYKLPPDIYSKTTKKVSNRRGKGGEKQGRKKRERGEGKRERRGINGRHSA